MALPYMVTPLHETGSRFAVDRLFAEVVTEGALAKFAPYSVFAMESCEPVAFRVPNLPGDSITTDIFHDALCRSAKLRNVPTPTFFTKRPLSNPEFASREEREVQEHEASIRGLNKLFEAPTNSVSIIQVADFMSPGDDAKYVARTVHEWGHGFGLGHCDIGACIMHASLDPEQAAKLGQSRTKNIFCESHERRLEQTTRLITGIGLYKLSSI